MARNHVTIQELSSDFHLAFIHNARHFVESSFHVERTPSGLFLMGRTRNSQKGFKKVAKLKPKRR